CRTEGSGAKDDADDAPGRFAESSGGSYDAGRDLEGLVGRFARMSSFRYQAIEGNGSATTGGIEADDRKAALNLLGKRRLFPSTLESVSETKRTPALPKVEEVTSESAPTAAPAGLFRKRVKRKDVTAFTREMSSLLAASIPIPQALDGLGEEEENPALKAV